MSDLESTPQEPQHNPFTAPEVSTPQIWQTSDAPAELFQSWSQPEAVPPTRIPHLGHLCVLALLAAIGFVCATIVMLVAIYFHLFGVASIDKAATEVHYILGAEAIIYLVSLGLSFIVFPLWWKKSFFAGIHWRGATALRLYWQLGAIAVGCFALAMLDETLLPGPSNVPIEDIFRSPGAAWLMFAFGVTFAPFFEEVAFRGFLLPSLATACDWIGERFNHQPLRPLDENDHPHWSMPAMVIASIATSLPFALIHAEQQGHALGPFLLLIVVSLILCAVRLKTRSLAASTLVHACYNFLIFFFMLIGTGGFRHLEKM
ncbi:MAG: CPBP family intramembrane glutamic endopeptidase [Terracidiphilus sp.]|jgi:membrane protease YdiL (CAAX protease family)